MASAFDEDGLAQARRILGEIDAHLSRSHGTDGVTVTDKQTERVLRVLRILTDHVEYLSLERGE